MSDFDNEFQFIHMPEPIWNVEIKSIHTVINTPNHCSWWFRFWTKFFFGAEWTKL